MAGAYCKFCDRRCFVYRVVPDGPHKGWAGHMATCARGAELDRQLLGYDHTTAINPVAADAAAVRPVMALFAASAPSGARLRDAVERLLNVLDDADGDLVELAREPDSPPVECVPVAAVLRALGMTDVGEDLDDVFPPASRDGLRERVEAWLEDEPLIVGAIRRDMLRQPDGEGGALVFTPATKGYGGTGCPGDTLVRWLNDLRALLDQPIGEPPAAPDRLDELARELLAMCDDEWLRRRDRYMGLGKSRLRDNGASAMEFCAHQVRQLLRGLGYERSSRDSYLEWVQSGRPAVDEPKAGGEQRG